MDFWQEARLNCVSQIVVTLIFQIYITCLAPLLKIMIIQEVCVSVKSTSELHESRKCTSLVACWIFRAWHRAWLTKCSTIHWKVKFDRGRCPVFPLLGRGQSWGHSSSWWDTAWGAVGCCGARGDVPGGGCPGGLPTQEVFFSLWSWRLSCAPRGVFQQSSSMLSDRMTGSWVTVKVCFFVHVHMLDTYSSLYTKCRSPWAWTRSGPLAESLNSHRNRLWISLWTLNETEASSTIRE